MNQQRFLSRALLLTALGATALSLGCSDGDTPSSSGASSSGTGGAAGASSASGAGGAGGAASAIQWGSCPSDYLSECASVPLPLDFSKPEGETLPVFVSRRLAGSGAGKAQVWLLQGGPGGSGNVFKGVVEQAADFILPDVDFYVLEHRGVGLSERLGCADQEAPASEAGASIAESEWPACISALKGQWGDKLAHFTITADSEDLAQLIELTREPDKKVIVYGVSYGTARALRFLEHHPSAVDGVILDSIVSPGVLFLSNYDQQYDPVAKDLSALCAADAVCGKKLGADPWAKIGALLAKLDGGHCADLGMNREVLEQLLPLFVQARSIRAHLFPLLYRLDRCDAGDVVVLGHYIQALTAALQGGAGAPLRASGALQMHLALSELWEEPAPSAAELKEECDALSFCPKFGPVAGSLYDIWPRYPHDAYTNQWPSFEVPILAMNGTLDPQTPIASAKALADRLTGPHQTFVTVPFCPHGVAFESAVKTVIAPTCGLQMMTGFVADPTQPIDTTCLADLVPVTFAEKPAVIQALFGTSDMWENTTPLADKKPAVIDWRAVVQMARDKTRP